MRIPPVIPVVLLIFAAGFSALASEPYYCTSQGRVLEYERREVDSGKLVWRHTLTVLNVESEKVSSCSRFTKENGKEIALVEYEAFVGENGNVITDLNATMAGAIRNFLPKAKIESTFSPTTLPSELTPGRKLPDAFSSIKVMGKPFTTTVTERSVLRYETLETPAGSFDCVVVTEHKVEKFYLYNRDTVSYTWYARGLGMVRHDTWKNKRLETSEVLVRSN